MRKNKNLEKLVTKLDHINVKKSKLFSNKTTRDRRLKKVYGIMKTSFEEYALGNPSDLTGFKDWQPDIAALSQVAKDDCFYGVLGGRPNMCTSLFRLMSMGMLVPHRTKSGTYDHFVRSSMASLIDCATHPSNARDVKNSLKFGGVRVWNYKNTVVDDFVGELLRTQQTHGLFLTGNELDSFNPKGEFFRSKVETLRSFVKANAGWILNDMPVSWEVSKNNIVTCNNSYIYSTPFKSVLLGISRDFCNTTIQLDYLGGLAQINKHTDPLKVTSYGTTATNSFNVEPKHATSGLYDNSGSLTKLNIEYTAELRLAAVSLLLAPGMFIEASNLLAKSLAKSRGDDSGFETLDSGKQHTINTNEALYYLKKDSCWPDPVKNFICFKDNSFWHRDKNNTLSGMSIDLLSEYSKNKSPQDIVDEVFGKSYVRLTTGEFASEVRAAAISIMSCNTPEEVVEKYNEAENRMDTIGLGVLK